MSYSQYEKCKPTDSFRGAVGGYDPRNALNQWAHRSCALSRFGPSKEISILDAMAGPGKFGNMILEMNRNKVGGPKIKMSFNDARLEPLLGLQSSGAEVIHSDIRTLAVNSAFDIVIERFGLKDLPYGHLANALDRIRNSLRLNGRLVIADMFAVSEKTQEAAISIHAAEQRFAGRNEAVDGICHIPTIEGWISALASSSFRASVRFTRARGAIELSVFKSWLKSESEYVEKMDMLFSAIADACNRQPNVAIEYGIKLAGTIEKTTISWPYAVIVGEKI